MTGYVLHARRLAAALTLFGLAFLAAGEARAQFGPRALVAPGQPVPPQLAVSNGGPAGREIAGLIGRRPVFGVYWRPGDPASEQALVTAAAVAQAGGPALAFFPVAALAAGQSPAVIAERQRALGLVGSSGVIDSGQLAMMLGVRAVPSFFLVDAGGVLRLVGGADVNQAGPSGVTIAQAVEQAGRGVPVPTLGVLGGDPVYRMLGRKLPAATVVDAGGQANSRLADLTARGKRLLVFYWSPTCPHCVAALPRLREWYTARAPKDLLLVGIARADVPALRAEAVRLIRGYPGVQLLDVDRSAGTGLMVRETPTVFLVSRKGEIEAIRTGGDIDWDAWVNGTATRASRAH